MLVCSSVRSTFDCCAVVAHLIYKGEFYFKESLVNKIFVLCLAALLSLCSVEVR